MTVYKLWQTPSALKKQYNTKSKTKLYSGAIYANLTPNNTMTFWLVVVHSIRKVVDGPDSQHSLIFSGFQFIRSVLQLYLVHSA